MIRAALLVGLGSLFVGGCSSSTTPSFPGWIEAEDLRISAEVGGLVLRLFVQEGKQVAQGAPIAALDDTPFAHRIQALAAELEAMRATLAALQSELLLAKKRLQRMEQLYERRAASQEALDRARTQYAALRARRRAAAARIRALQARLAEAKRKQRACFVRAPVAGRIVEVFVREGERAPPLAPLVRLRPKGAVKIVAFVPEKAMAGLALGKRLFVRVNGGKPFAATLVRIADQLEFTPPVLFAEEQRARLVRRIELMPPEAIASDLPVGAPVDLWLGNGAR